MTSATTTIAAVADVVGRAATDSAFREQLLSAPAATLANAGIAVPEGVSIHVLENSTTLLHLVLPDRPAGVSDADLQPTSASSSTPSSTPEKLEAYGRLVVATWTDSALKARLLADPATVLAERGITISSGVNVRIVEATATTSYLVLPGSTS